ncbi:hypothetical protein MMPV_006190 [Pyropia vietnamensis]
MSATPPPNNPFQSGAIRYGSATPHTAKRGSRRGSTAAHVGGTTPAGGGAAGVGAAAPAASTSTPATSGVAAAVAAAGAAGGATAPTPRKRKAGGRASSLAATAGDDVPSVPQAATATPGRPGAAAMGAPGAGGVTPGSVQRRKSTVTVDPSFLASLMDRGEVIYVGEAKTGGEGSGGKAVAAQAAAAAPVVAPVAAPPAPAPAAPATPVPTIAAPAAPVVAPATPAVAPATPAVAPATPAVAGRRSRPLPSAAARAALAAASDVDAEPITDGDYTDGDAVTDGADLVAAAAAGTPATDRHGPAEAREEVLRSDVEGGGRRRASRGGYRRPSAATAVDYDSPSAPPPGQWDDALDAGGVTTDYTDGGELDDDDDDDDAGYSSDGSATSVASRSALAVSRRFTRMPDTELRAYLAAVGLRVPRRARRDELASLAAGHAAYLAAEAAAAEAAAAADVDAVAPATPAAGGGGGVRHRRPRKRAGAPGGGGVPADTEEEEDEEEEAPAAVAAAAAAARPPPAVARRKRRAADAAAGGDGASASPPASDAAAAPPHRSWMATLARRTGAGIGGLLFLSWLSVVLPPLLSPTAYCDTGVTVPVTLDDGRVCVLCPDHGVCSGGVLSCEDGFVPRRGRCVEDAAVALFAEELADVASRELAARAGAAACNSWWATAPSPAAGGMGRDELADGLSSWVATRRSRGRLAYEESKTDVALSRALMDLVADPRYGVEVATRATDGVPLLYSTRPAVPLRCRVRWWLWAHAGWVATVAAVAGTVARLAAARRAAAARAARVAGLVDHAKAYCRWTKECALAGEMDTAAVIDTHLRDELIPASDPDRLRLWEEVAAALRRDTRLARRVGLPHGFAKVSGWEWRGAVARGSRSSAGSDAGSDGGDRFRMG